MNFTVEQREHAAIFRPQEARLDSAMAPDLKAEFLILAQPDVESLIIDLTEVRYVDSAGLSALLLARRQQAAHDGEVRLVGVCDDVRSLLELTQLNRVFAIFETVQQALDAPMTSLMSPDDGEEHEGSMLIRGAVAAALGAGAFAALGDDDEAVGAEDDDDDYDEEDDDEDYDDEDDDEDEAEKKGEEAEDETAGDDEFAYEEDIEFDEDEDDDDV